MLLHDAASYAASHVPMNNCVPISLPSTSSDYLLAKEARWLCPGVVCPRFRSIHAQTP